MTDRINVSSLKINKSVFSPDGNNKTLVVINFLE